LVVEVTKLVENNLFVDVRFGINVVACIIKIDLFVEINEFVENDFVEEIDVCFGINMFVCTFLFKMASAGMVEGRVRQVQIVFVAVLVAVVPL
jgi:hypothetical protein